MTFVRVEAGVGIGRITNGVTGHILGITNDRSEAGLVVVSITDFELITENPLKNDKTFKRRRRCVAELHNNSQEVLASLAKASSGNAWSSVGKGAIALTVDIAADHIRTDPGMQIRMMARELANEFCDPLDNDAEPRQTAHCRAKSCRVHPLSARINIECNHQTIRQRAKHDLVETVINDTAAIVSDGLFAKIAVRFRSDVKGVVPSHIEGKSFHRLCVSQIL